MTLADQLIAAEKAVTAAASQSYPAYQAAKAHRDALIELLRMEQMAAAGIKPDSLITVVGNTYQNKATLKSMGLRWDAQARAWVGKAASAWGRLPAGCTAVAYGEAVLRSMDHPDSLA